MLNLIQARREIKKQYNIQLDFNLEKLGKKNHIERSKIKRNPKKEEH